MATSSIIDPHPNSINRFQWITMLLLGKIQGELVLLLYFGPIPDI